MPDPAPSVAAVGRAFPPHYYDQEALIAALREHWGRRHFNVERIESLHRHVLVGGRHLALPLEDYSGLDRWGLANDAWIRVGQEVGAEAIRCALAQAGLGVDDVDALFFATVTGISTPSLDARLVNRLRLPTHVRRTPIFGLGCVAGAAGLARAADYLRAYPGHVAVLLSVELCSLTLQQDDLSVPNLVATGLFGDGAAAVVLTGAGRSAPGPRVLASRSVFYPDSERVMGWDISESGFRVVLSADVPAVVLDHVGRDVDAFLADNGLARADVARWIAHPGGPKVLEALQQTLGLPATALEASWRSLKEVGNLSSASVLLILEDNLREPAAPGAYGVVLAMGPGFCSELVLLQW
jgi:alkylresorcinol/alkylpyrone synthase